MYPEWDRVSGSERHTECVYVAQTCLKNGEKIESSYPSVSVHTVKKSQMVNYIIISRRMEQAMPSRFFACCARAQ